MDIGFIFAIIIWTAVMITSFILLFIIRERMSEKSDGSGPTDGVDSDFGAA